MVRRKFLAMHLCIFASLCPLPVSAEPRTITKSEVRTGAPDATHNRLRDVVWDMFEEQDYRRDEKPTRPLTDIYLQTRTYATQVPGLCRHDSVWVEFEATTSSEQGADTPMRATGLRSTSYFAFVVPPAEDFEEIYDADPTDPGACTQLTEGHPFFAAEDEYRAVQGYRAFAVLQEAVRGADQDSIECNLFPTDEGKSCGEVIASLRPNQLDSVELCDSGSDWRTRCERIYVADRRIDVRLTPRGSGDSRPDAFVSARLESLIIMAHERID